MGLAILSLLFFIRDTEASQNTVEFRLLLTPEESKARGCDKVKIDGEAVNICTLPYLADRDIEHMEVFSSMNEPNRYLIRFTFNEHGKRMLYRLTKKYRGRSVAIFVGGKLIETAHVLPAVFMGEKVVIRWSGKERELRKIAEAMNKKLPDILALYAEEIGKYNDAAADSWAGAYMRVNSYIEGRQKQFRRDQALVEALRDEQE